MRLNKFIATCTDLSRRAADEAIATGRVRVNNMVPSPGQDVTASDAVVLDGQRLRPTTTAKLTIMFHKPPGYVVSRDGQGSKTIFELLPEKYQQLQAVGRLDKYSSGLLLLTNDGELANELTHPSRQKIKIYEIRINQPLQPLHQQMISDHGLTLDDGVSRLALERLTDDRRTWRVAMSEGRNRQIRRTFAAVGYTVTTLHRTQFGPYKLGKLAEAKTAPLPK